MNFLCLAHANNGTTKCLLMGEEFRSFYQCGLVQGLLDALLLLIPNEVRVILHSLKSNEFSDDIKLAVANLVMKIESYTCY